MKRVVNREQVAHLFAHQAQTEAYTASRNFYFYGNKCNSYGSHFRAAVHHGDTVLINRDNYSVTTARQMSALRMACSHLQTFDVENPDAETKAEHRENFRVMVREFETELLRASRARIYNDTAHAEQLRDNANRYAAWAKIGNRIKPVALDAIADRVKTRDARERAALKRERIAREKRRAAELEKQRAEYAEKLTAWRAGEGDCYTLGNYRYTDRARVRLTSDGATVQTSQGAEFPARHAARFIGFVLHCFDTGTDWKRNGQRVPLGHFQLDAIAGAGGVLRAGCHTVTANETRRLAALLTDAGHALPGLQESLPLNTGGE